MFEELFPQMIQVAMAGKAVTKVVRRCHAAKEDRNLDLSSCQLASFPDAVYHLMKNTVVATCDLSDNAFRKIPPHLTAKFANLTALNLSGNRLSSLPDEMREMGELQRLDLSHNDFMGAPRAAFTLPRLTILSLRRNFIVDVEVSRIRSAPSLRELNLELNPLTRTARSHLRSLPSHLLVLFTEPPATDEDSDEDFDASPNNGSV